VRYKLNVYMDHNLTSKNVSLHSINSFNERFPPGTCTLQAYMWPTQGRVGRIGVLLSVEHDRIVAHFNVASHNLLQGMWKIKKKIVQYSRL
jgi:hypothetical protein